MAQPARVVIYHNPRCSKSRAALELLEQAGVDFDVVRYLEDPPTAQRLGELVAVMGLSPRAAMRTKEKLYKELGLDDPRLDDAALLAAMAAHPVLIERPIVALGEKACLGRPPERVADFLADMGLAD